MPPSVSLRSPPTPQVGVGKKKMDSPFRLAPLATHPLSGVGQEKHGGEGRLTQNLASPCLSGRGTASLPQTLPPPRSRWQGTTFSNPCLPPLAGGGGPRSGGRGPIQAVDACEVGIRTLSKERVPSNIKGQVNQTTHLAGRQPAAPCPMQPFQHIKHPLTGRAFHVFTACSEETPMQIESAFLRILMHCCVMGLDMNESSLA